MVNPLDRSFFRFFFGFLSILAVSFTILYLVGRFSVSPDPQASAMEGK